jgi:hypothetical protein
MAWHALGYFENAFNARDQACRPLSRDESEDLILKAYMSEDFGEGMPASLNKRAPNFNGKWFFQRAAMQRQNRRRRGESLLEIAILSPHNVTS